MVEVAVDATLARSNPREVFDAAEEEVGRLLQAAHRELSLTPIADVASRPDASSVMLVSDSSGQVRGVLLCSSPAAPDMVQRAMSRAREAKAVVDSAEGAHILEPLAEGRIRGLSYAVLPHCARLSDSRVVSRLQRVALAPMLLDWLFNIDAATIERAPAVDLEQAFALPLQRMASLEVLEPPLRVAAWRARRRLSEGLWSPATVLMHGDLWKGNVLVSPATGELARQPWRRRFVVIDWPGSLRRGYPLYDLVRLGLSLGLGGRRWAVEVERHCALLRCEREDAMSYLLCALGHIAMNLGHFPLENFARMARSCSAALSRVIDTNKERDLQHVL